MSTIENRVVDMTFQNAAFERNVSTTMSTLDKLKAKLNFDGSRKSAEELQSSVSKFSMGGMAAGVQNVASSFSAMSVIGVTALATLTSAAVRAGADIVKSLTIGPALEGLREYETNLNSIQTVLANTSAKGTTLEDVNGALEELNEYSDKTIYNFSEMAKNIGTFTAAGVDLDASTSAIKGIANLAALSGSNSEQASTAMYQLSQAMSTGKVSLMDWNSVVNAGMGGQVFQDALVQTAKVQGIAVDDIIKKNGSFRDSLQEGWLTAEVLSQTLTQFTGDMSAEQLKAMGYTEKQIEGIIKMGETATNAATKVKTFTQLMGTLRESMGSGWSKSFQILLGDFEEAKAFFTSINDVISGSIGAGADARNALLQGWKDLGGRTVLIEAFWNILNSGLLIIDHIKVAFRDLFPKKTAQDLYDMTVRFRDFTKRIAEGAVNFGPFIRVLKGFFAIISIGWQFVKALASAVINLLQSFSGGGNAIYEFVGGIADWLVNLDAAIKKGDLFTKFFDKLGGYIRTAIGYLTQFGAFVGSIFSNIGLGDFGSSIAGIFTSLMDGSFSFDQVANVFSSAWGVIRGIASNITSELAPLGELFSNIFGGIKNWASDLMAALGPLGAEIKTQFAQIKEAIFGGFGDGDFSSLLEVLTVGFLGGLIMGIRKLIKDGLSVDLTGGIFENIQDALGGLTDTLSAMQTNLKADTLMKIAAAVGILTLSVIALSNIDADKLAKAMGAIAVGMGQLVGAMAILATIGTGLGVVKIPVIAAGMVLLAGAVLLLSLAVKSMADLSWDELGRGMAGVAAGMGLMTASMSVLSGISGGILRAGLAMIPMALGLRLLANAVAAFASLDWGTMARGMTGVATGLLVITAAMRAMPPNIMANALGLLVVAGALKVLATAIQDFGDIPWGTMGKGMLGIAGALVIIAGALKVMPKNIMAQSLALIAIGVAMKVLASALASMGGMSWEEIGKGLATLAGALLILGGALQLMTGTLAGAVALAAVVVALAAFLPVLIALGSLSWETILTGLGALAGVFVVLGVAGLLLAPIAPALLAVAVAMGIFGLGVVLFGAGALMTAQAIGILVAAGTAGLALLIQVVGAIIAKIPEFLAAVATGIIGMIEIITANAPKIVAAMVAIAGGLLDAVVDLAPKIRVAIGTVLDTLLGVISDNAPKIIQAGIDLLLDFLKGIAQNIGDVTQAATDIITEFLEALETTIPQIIEAGWDLLVAVVDGMANSVESNLPRLLTAGGELVQAVVDGFINGLSNLAGYVKQKAMDFFSGVWNGVKEFFGIASPSKKFFWVGEMLMTGLANGIDDKGQRAVDAADHMSHDVMDAMTSTLQSLPSLFEGLTDIRPTISPVLDLSAVRSEAGRINGLLTPTSINPSAAIGQAQAISRSQQVSSQVAPEDVAPVPQQLIFEQTINSPTPLTTVDIYRDSRSLLSMAKGALGV